MSHLSWWTQTAHDKRMLVSLRTLTIDLKLRGFWDSYKKPSTMETWVLFHIICHLCFLRLYLTFQIFDYPFLSLHWWFQVFHKHLLSFQIVLFSAVPKWGQYIFYMVPCWIFFQLPHLLQQFLLPFPFPSSLYWSCCSLHYCLIHVTWVLHA